MPTPFASTKRVRDSLGVFDQRGDARRGTLQPLLITRLFRNEAPATIPPLPTHILFVESAPGRLEDEYGFESERVRIRAAVGADGGRADNDARRPQRIMERLKTPQVSELKKTIRRGQWEVIHVTGVDTHQAEQYIEDMYDAFQKKPAIWKKIADSSDRIRDGMILREGNVAELPVSYVLPGVLLGVVPP